MSNKKTQEQILNEYEQKSKVILQKMMHVIIRAQRKIDDEAYRHALEKIEMLEGQKGE